MFVSLTYEVFGKVQGVFFRKFTREKAIELKLVGWVKNTDQGTVIGIAQGERTKIDSFKQWLQFKGSPRSRVDRAEFKEEEIVTVEFSKFEIRH